MAARSFGRRSATVVLGLGLSASLLFLAVPGAGQAPPPPAKNKNKKTTDPEQPAGGTGSQFSVIRMANDGNMTKRIDAAHDAIEKEKNWEKAVTILQESILNKDGSYYVQVREKDVNLKETVRWTSARIEANILMGKLPDEALNEYELKYGPEAREMLNEAKKKKNDRELLTKVAHRYLYTRAGIEANDILATFQLDRGQYAEAALRFEKILDMKAERTRLSDLTLFKAALAFSRCGDKKRYEDTWDRLSPRLEARGGLKVGEDIIPVVYLKELFVGKAVVNPFDWIMVHGNVRYDAQANGSQPALDYTMFPPVSTLLDSAGSDTNPAAMRIREAIAEQQNLEKGGAVLSGFFPVVTGKMVVFRTHNDIQALSLVPTRDPSGTEIPAGGVMWKAGGISSSVRLLSEGQFTSTLNGFLDQFRYVPGYRSFLYENSLIGTISTDGRLVYAVDDLAIPAPPSMMSTLNGGQGWRLKTRILENYLTALDAGTGKMIWNLGNWKPDQNDTEQSADERENLFAGSHFLSVPISVGGKLYVLNEKNHGMSGDAELRLVCIDPSLQKVTKGRPFVYRNEKGEPGQVIGTVPQINRFTHDPVRRTNSAYMAYDKGLLVCTTNAGDVFGIDVLTRDLVWTYGYRESMPAGNQSPQFPNPGFNPRPVAPVAPLVAPLWKSAPPVISEDRVVFTAPDAPSLHCINLRDGKQCWRPKRHQEGDLYFAGVFAGKILIVGKNYVRVLRLSDGEEIWREATHGMPTGQGVASKNVYYLPLKNKDKAEIVAFDLDRLAVKSRNPAVNSRSDIGNLVFYDGMVVSQTPTSLAVYYELKKQLELASEEVRLNPGNGVSLFKRGKWLLADGQVQPAVDDIRAALKKELPADVKAEARQKLFQAMTDMMQINFKEARGKYLGEYLEVCNVPDNPREQQERLAKYYRVVGEGYEAADDLMQAFHMYRQFGSLDIVREPNYSLMDDPAHTMPTNVWLRGRIANLAVKAKKLNRKELDEKIAEEWAAVRAKKDPDALRAFVDMFDVPVPVGRQARLQLAETIVERDQRPAFLEAELNLQQLRANEYFSDPEISARALAGLGKLHEKRATPDAMKLAASYYRELRREYPDAKLADGKTSSKLYDELTTDPRFLEYLEEQGPIFANETLRSRELNGVPPGQLGFVLQPEGDMTPLVRQTRLLLDGTSSPPRLRCYNFASNTLRWTLDLGAEPFNFQVFNVLYSGNQPKGGYKAAARFRFYQVRGNLAVVQVGTLCYCIDMDLGRVLWQQSLFDRPSNPNMQLLETTTDADGNLEFMFQMTLNRQVSYMPVGHVGAVRAGYVALMTPKGLLVVDPIRGTPLWRNRDVPIHTRVFGDDQHIFTVDMTEGNAGSGRVFRAIDGISVNVPDFGQFYQNRVRLMGRKVLTATPGVNKTLRLYDIITGKDVWKHEFQAQAAILATEDPGLTGAIEPNGMATVLDAATGRVLLQTSLLQPQVTPADILNLDEPVLLQDRDRYYFALNRPASPKVMNGVLFSNFSNGLRCRPVNGWVMSFFREDGQHLGGSSDYKWTGEKWVGEKKMVKHKKGEFDWRSPVRMENQMIVLEQFENLPVMIFSSRYQVADLNNPNNNVWNSTTLALNRTSGKWVYSGQRPGQGPAFSSFLIDTKEGTINLIGGVSVQFYVDDRKMGPAGVGRLAPLAPGTALAERMLNVEKRLAEQPALPPPADFTIKIQKGDNK